MDWNRDVLRYWISPERWPSTESYVNRILLYEIGQSDCRRSAEYESDRAGSVARLTEPVVLKTDIYSVLSVSVPLPRTTPPQIQPVVQANSSVDSDENLTVTVDVPARRNGSAISAGR